MKRCPTCQQTYTDESLGFCTNDGTPLVRETSYAGDLQATIMATPPPPQQAQTPSSSQSYQPASPPSWSSGTPQFAPSTPPQQPKPVMAYFILGGTILGAGFLLFIWLIGAIVGIGGAFIHIFLLLGLLIGFVGVIAGGVMLFAGKR